MKPPQVDEQAIRSVDELRSRPDVVESLNGGQRLKHALESHEDLQAPQRRNYEAAV